VGREGGDHPQKTNHKHTEIQSNWKGAHQKALKNGECGTSKSRVTRISQIKKLTGSAGTGTLGQLEGKRKSKEDGKPN